MRVALFSTAFLLVMFAASNSVLACDCMTPPEPQCFENAGVVFEGEVVLVLYNKKHPNIPIGHVFKVTKTLKGKPVSEVTIFGRGSNCDAQFSLGSAYRVFANESEGKLRSFACAGNKWLYHNKARSD